MKVGNWWEKGKELVKALLKGETNAKIDFNGLSPFFITIFQIIYIKKIKEVFWRAWLFCGGLVWTESIIFSTKISFSFFLFLIFRLFHVHWICFWHMSLFYFFFNFFYFLNYLLKNMHAERNCIMNPSYRIIHDFFLII